MRHAVIMAGGAGTRLWPLSRTARPKQLLPIFGGRSLLRQSFDRLRSLLPAEQVYVITGAAHVPLVGEELPELPPENIFGEPTGRDTANAVGLAAAILHRRDPDGEMGIFTADHVINPVSVFHETLDRAFKTAADRPDALVTLGIRPQGAHTGYGYIQRGVELGDGVFEVVQFTEKPDVTSAMRYVASGDYYWNSGMFTWRLGAILAQIQKHLRGSYEGLMECARAWDTPNRRETLERIYPNLMRISIDFAVMERAERVLVVEMNCQWIDVGSWTALEQVVGGDSDGNVSVSPRAVHLGSRGNVIVSEDDHLIATIGVDDLVIVRSKDATLICAKRDAQGLKELVARVRERFGDQYL